ncbi:DUF4169 family protein [Bauldia sp.]|uniref:DUF4169 family protein n=1 Tax=Bauldia sp. TaxID=2575872 RepID=UPI003BABED2A
MAAKIVNLRRARKAKARRDKESRAEANRQWHGLSKIERRALEAEREKTARHLDEHRRDTDDA